jgi:DNA/RNA endonuclease G (NUC1)
MKSHFTLNAGLRPSFLPAILLLAFTPALHATLDNTLQMQLGNPSGATANSSDHDNYLLDSRTASAVDFSDNLGDPNWVSWDLTSSDIGDSGRHTSFYQDTLLPSGFNRLTDGDYTNSGYDRGHMCPSYDRTDTWDNNKLVFYMSNIVPQTSDNNSGIWQSFEEYCQDLAQDGNELLIITGPSLFTGFDIQPSGEAAIPGYVWKIVVVVPAGSGTAASRITVDTRVITIKVPNISGIYTDPWEDYITTPSEIETDTGLTFFTDLSSTIANALRIKEDAGEVSTTSDGVTISQVYGGGGNSGSTYKNDFIELYNAGSTPVSLSTYAVQYTGSTGTTWSVTNLSGTIAPGHYFLVKEAAGGGGTTDLPTADATGSINLAATSGKVALTNTQTALSGSNPVGGATIVDFVGFGSANAYEGAGAAPTLSATASGLRGNAGATDSNVNSADFSTGAVNPRNAAIGGGVRISQVYGGGGNSGSTYKNDFIEIYNSGTATVNLANYAVQYASSSSSSWSATNLSGTLAPGHYYLVKEGAGGGGTTELPTPQATGAINMSASSGKIALTKNQTLLNVSNPIGTSAVIDFVGFGTANAYEGAGAAPTLSATTAALRAGSGATDSDSNSADFSSGAVNPRNN